MTTAPFQMTRNNGSTAEILLNLARSLLPNADKIFNSNPVLRRAVAIDMQATEIKKTIRATVPKLDRDAEITENILAKFRAAAGTDNQKSLDTLMDQFDTASKKAKQYHDARKKGIDTLLTNIKAVNTVLTTMATSAGESDKPIAYGQYLEQLRTINQDMKISENSLGTLAKDAITVRDNFKEVATGAVNIMRTWPEAKQRQVPGGIMPTQTQEYDSPNPDD